MCNTATETVVVERRLFKSYKAGNLESVICLYVNIAWEAAADCNKKIAHIVCVIFCYAFIEVKLKPSPFYVDKFQLEFLNISYCCHRLGQFQIGISIHPFSSEEAWKGVFSNLCFFFFF